MDRLLYTAANGASRTMEQQAAIANNMANVGTTGFRAQFSAYRAVPVVNVGEEGQGDTTRVLTVAATENNKLEEGPLKMTGRSLDVAIQGDGWLAVRTKDGGEGYTRAGNLLINAAGQLATASGKIILSDNGAPIDLSDSREVSIETTGGINSIQTGGRPKDVQRIAQLKLVTPDSKTLVRDEDGLFRSINAQGEPQVAPHNEEVRVLGNALEGSNVSAADSMVSMITNARRFEMQMKMIADANQNAQTANSILSANN